MVNDINKNRRKAVKRTDYNRNVKSHGTNSRNMKGHGSVNSNNAKSYSTNGNRTNSRNVKSYSSGSRSMNGRNTESRNMGSRKPVSRPGKRPQSKIAWLFDLRLGEVDFTFLTLVIVIVCIGLIMVFSASAPRALQLTGDSFYFIKRQLGFVAIGFIAMIYISKIDYKKYEKYAPYLMLICLVLLALVLFPKIGVENKGSRRWLNTPIVNIQPSELMKPVMAMFIAKIIQQKYYDPKTLKGIGRMFIWVGITALLMMLETHLSGTIIICGIAVMVMLAGGIRIRYFIALAAVIVPAGCWYVFTDPVRSKRMFVAFNPFLDKMGTGYQACQGLYAIASGGLFGKGLGQSIQKNSFLPEPYNDFIFAVICEELGLLGAVLVVVLFVALILRGIKIATEAPDVFGTLTIMGIMSHIMIQTLFNICVVATLAPNTGVTLPFFSYGGTAIIVLLMEMGIVLNVSRHMRRKM